jgi:hypothetical protein
MAVTGSFIGLPAGPNQDTVSLSLVRSSGIN